MADDLGPYVWGSELFLSDPGLPSTVDWSDPGEPAMVEKSAPLREDGMMWVVYRAMKGRLEALDREVEFLKLENQVLKDELGRRPKRPEVVAAETRDAALVRATRR